MLERDLMNRGRKRKTRPRLVDKQVEFISCTPTDNPNKWVVSLKVNGWPHDVGMWAKDELDVMKQVMEMQRGKVPDNAFDISE